MEWAGVLKKYKNKVLREYFIKFLLYSLSLGVFAAAMTIMTIIMLSANSFLPWLPVVSGGVVFLVSFILFSVIGRPTTEEIALRIDHDLKLHEKTATMIEFTDKSGIIIDKQREDAIENLKTNTPKNVHFHLSCSSLIVLAVSASLFTGSFFTPRWIKFNNHPHTVLVDPDNTTHEIAEEAKENIWKFGATKDVENQLLQILDAAESAVEGITDVTERSKILDEYIAEVDPIVDAANSKEEIGTCLVNNSTVDSMKTFGVAIYNGDIDQITDALQVIKEGINNYENENLEEYLRSLISDISTVLNDIKNNTTIIENDGLYKALNSLRSFLSQKLVELQNGMLKNASEYSGDELIDKNSETSEVVRDELYDGLDTFFGMITAAVDIQNNNIAAGEYVKQVLEQMKDPQNSSGSGSSDSDENGDENDSNNNSSGNENDDSGDDSNNGDNGSGSDDGNESNNSGNDSGNNGSGNGSGDSSTAGGGKGDMTYGGNDHVYTGDNGDTEYGDVIDDYHNAAVDAGKGSDLAGVIDDYFEILYGSGNNNP